MNFSCLQIFFYNLDILWWIKVTDQSRVKLDKLLCVVSMWKSVFPIAWKDKIASFMINVNTFLPVIILIFLMYVKLVEPPCSFQGIPNHHSKHYLWACSDVLALEEPIIVWFAYVWSFSWKQRSLNRTTSQSFSASSFQRDFTRTNSRNCHISTYGTADCVSVIVRFILYVQGRLV